MVVIGNKKLTPDCLNGIYKDVAIHLGMDTAAKVFQHYKGLQVTFPQRFLSKAYVVEQVNLEYDGSNLKELSRKYGYSERVVRSWITRDE